MRARSAADEAFGALESLVARGFVRVDRSVRREPRYFVDPSRVVSFSFASRPTRRREPEVYIRRPKSCG